MPSVTVQVRAKDHVDSLCTAKRSDADLCSSLYMPKSVASPSLPCLRGHGPTSERFNVATRRFGFSFRPVFYGCV